MKNKFTSICLPLALYFLLALLPFRLAAQWENTKGPQGATVYQLLMNQGRLFAATSGGLYYSDDMAEHWQLNPDISSANGVTSICAHNGKLYLILVFQIEENYSQSYHYSIMVSSDNGNTWSIALGELGISYSFVNYYKIAVLQNKLVVKDLFNTVSFSDDGGQNWNKIKQPNNFTHLIYSNQNLYAVGLNWGLYFSQNLGKDWTMLADSTDGYYDVRAFQGDKIVVEHFGLNADTSVFLYSDDWGQNWSHVTQPPNDQYYVNFQFWGQSGDTLVAKSNKLYFSTDKGLSWQAWNIWGPEMEIPSILTPTGGFNVYNDLGVRRYDAATQSWAFKNEGLNAKTINFICASGPLLFAKSFETIYGSADGGQNWSVLPIYRSYDQNDFGFFVKGDTFYIQTGEEIIFSPQNGAQPWDTLVKIKMKRTMNLFGNNFCSGVILDGKMVIVDARNGALDTLNSPSQNSAFNDFLIKIGNRLVYTDNSGSAWISENMGQSWTNTLNRTIPGNNTSNRLYYLNNYLYLATRYDILRSGDTGNTWEVLSSSGLPRDYDNNIKTLLSMVNIGNVLFAALPYSGVYYSVDLGQNWHALNDGLNNLRGRCLVVHDGHLLLGTSTSSIWKRKDSPVIYSGRVYLDSNDNQLYDAGDQILNNQVVTTRKSNTSSLSQTDGIYTVYSSEAGPDTVQLVSAHSFATVTPSFYAVNGGGGSNMNFAVKLAPDVSDLSVDLTNIEAFNRGFVTRLVIQVENNGSTTQSPVVRLAGSPWLEFFSYDPIISNSVKDTLFWQLPGLAPFESKSIIVYAAILSTASIDSTIHLSAIVLPNSLDVTPDNNVSLLVGKIVSSFDPNDKVVQPEGNLTPDQIASGQTMTYTVRFQNTGNYPATFVRILDTLSGNFDLSTLRVLKASHNCTWKLAPNKVLEFYFDQINLPDSTANAEGSHGFVKYSIQTKKSLDLNANIQNTAHIFFDFNEPVVTNTTKTMVVPKISDNSSLKSQNLSISPNPARDRIVIQWSDLKGGTLQMINARAQLVLEQKVADGLGILEVSVGNLPAGTYTMQLVRKGAILSGQAVIVR